MKRIVTMQDISCIGKCSLTAALPIISAMGIETAVLPTAVLSTHTAFQSFTFHDLTADIRDILDHWKKEGFTFDAIYTGYLGSFEQLELAEQLFDEFGRDALIIVDPCMGDGGKLYPGFTQEFADAMAKLCAKADVICPNLTEASYLLQIPYREEYDESYIRDVLLKLSQLGAEKTILTGTSLEKGKIGITAYDRAAGSFYHYSTEEEPGHFHGTGDIWASTFTGAVMDGFSFEESSAIACDYVRECIRCTLNDPHHRSYGVNFEEAIPYLLKRIGR